ncbi:hypothetical protein [Flagellimonas halotolerans]|uniref:DUF1648 domain-containing protein n=1 Tax=Flagellimonas halotolerans TaxID=3112164 RepID=A0ABU6IQ03_9FLAO|nr:MULTISPECIES: hypothetical protein [unclassified Allomuricauda]MEC3965280.1 hypothetical protein [Muricauda sp. SYSU M86414]MEC4265146.1 hypothetical protein [Muricauda sp. SYSU M84420]
MESRDRSQRKWQLLGPMVLMTINLWAIWIVIELFGYDQLVDHFNPEGITKRVHPGKPARLLFISVLCNLFPTLSTLFSKLMDIGER